MGSQIKISARTYYKTHELACFGNVILIEVHNNESQHLVVVNFSIL
jgi:hypothetical protein